MKPLLIANWKLYVRRPTQALELLDATARAARTSRARVVLCPPAPLISFIVNALGSRNKNLAVGAQDVFWEDEGAFTGSFGPRLLKQIRASYVIVGHSERRRVFGETDGDVSRKLNASFAAGLHPVVCVGERSRKVNWRRELSAQFLASIKGISRVNAAKLIVAYEPVWAIGTGRADTPAEAAGAIVALRGLLAKAFGKKISSRAIMLYGGSVSAGNVGGFLNHPEINGALIGRASTVPREFERIIARI